MNKIIYHLKAACKDNASCICHAEERSICNDDGGLLLNQILRLRLRMTNGKDFIFCKLIIRWGLNHDQDYYHLKAARKDNASCICHGEVSDLALNKQK